MPVSVNPVQRQESDTDQIMKALSAAQGILGTVFDVRKMVKGEAIDKQQREQQFAKDFTPVEKGTEGAISLTMGENKGFFIPRAEALARKKAEADRPIKELDLAKKQADAINAELQTKKNKLEIAKQEQELTGIKKPTQLKPVDIERFGMGRDAVNQLASLEKTINESIDKFGPVMGRIGQYNEYDAEAQTVQAAVNTAKQTIGKYLEGGVLRKEDEVKYERILPKLSDTPEVAMAKLGLVRNLLKNKLDNNLDALVDQGYDIAGLNIKDPMILELMSQKGIAPKQNINQAGAAPSQVITPDQFQQWLRTK